MRHAITLYRGPQAWMARHTDPEVTRLFGTDTLPTAFTEQAEPAEVLAYLREANPELTVRMVEGGAA